MRDVPEVGCDCLLPRMTTHVRAMTGPCQLTSIPPPPRSLVLESKKGKEEGNPPPGSVKNSSGEKFNFGKGKGTDPWLFLAHDPPLKQAPPPPSIVYQSLFHSAAAHTPAGTLCIMPRGARGFAIFGPGCCWPPFAGACVKIRGAAGTWDPDCVHLARGSPAGLPPRKPPPSSTALRHASRRCCTGPASSLEASQDAPCGAKPLRWTVPSVACAYAPHFRLCALCCSQSLSPPPRPPKALSRSQAKQVMTHVLVRDITLIHSAAECAIRPR